jgi:hypothetical protein
MEQAHSIKEHCEPSNASHRFIKWQWDFPRPVPKHNWSLKIHNFHFNGVRSGLLKMTTHKIKPIWSCMSHLGKSLNIPSKSITLKKMVIVLMA